MPIFIRNEQGTDSIPDWSFTTRMAKFVHIRTTYMCNVYTEKHSTLNVETRTEGLGLVQCLQAPTANNFTRCGLFAFCIIYTYILSNKLRVAVYTVVGNDFNPRCFGLLKCSIRSRGLV